MEKQKLVVMCGPTASGKSALAVELALRLGGEVVSADSMQIYRGMDIGTAKPSVEDMRGVPHHMIDCVDIHETYSAARYREEARACISQITERGALPILCGGTGLYISAVVYPLDFSAADADEAYRAELVEFARREGNEALHQRLAALNPEAAAAIHPNNVKRVIRALEKRKSENSIPAETRQPIFNGAPLYELAWIGLTLPRESLYRRIDARVDDMMRRGLMEEVTDLASRHNRETTAFQALGYKELLKAIDGKASIADAVDAIKQGTRNYAKRQMTWFKREASIRWFDPTEYGDGEELFDATAGYIHNTLHIG